MEKQYDIILFDLDGTLLDTGYGITKSVKYALDKHQIEINDWSELYRFVGPPLLDSFMNYYGMDKEEATIAIDDYRECYLGGAMFENKVYEGMTETLEKLTAAGKKVMVATSKPEEMAKTILAHHGMDHYFTYIAGALMDESRTTKSEVIDYLFEENHVTDEDKCRVLMIGDREYDVIGAKCCGVDSVGVIYGYGSREELEAAGANYLVDTPKEILQILDLND